MSAMQLCQKLKSEAIAKRDAGAVNNLRLRILDYFIDRDVPDDIFAEALESRINDPDPSKEQSKIICAKILESWQTSLEKGYEK